jgi:hypothetical protein
MGLFHTPNLRNIKNMLFFKVSPILKQHSEKRLPACFLLMQITPTNAGYIIPTATAWVLFIPLAMLLEIPPGILKNLIWESHIFRET